MNPLVKHWKCQGFQPMNFHQGADRSASARDSHFSTRGASRGSAGAGPGAVGAAKAALKDLDGVTEASWGGRSRRFQLEMETCWAYHSLTARQSTNNWELSSEAAPDMEFSHVIEPRNMLDHAGSKTVKMRDSRSQDISGQQWRCLRNHGLIGFVGSWSLEGVGWIGVVGSESRWVGSARLDGIDRNLADYPDRPDHPDSWPSRPFIHGVDPGSSLTLILRRWSEPLDVDSGRCSSTTLIVSDTEFTR